MSGDIKDLSQQGFHSAVGGRGNYQNSFGLNVKGILKPFTTDIEVSGYPSYEEPVVSGYGSADAKGLNPYGKNTIGEGLLWGEDNVDVNRGIPDGNTVRSLGIKNPMTFVGWGYDTFGFPAPNYSQNWNTSGYYSETKPATGFVNILGEMIPSGADTSFYDWLSGPLDLRWDNIRKVWTGNHGGVQAGRIKAVTISGDTYDPEGYYYAEAVTYDAEIYDGIANYIEVTGVSHIGPKPPEVTYKIKPVPSGDFCFIVNHPDENDVPKLSIWLTELPQVEECSGQEFFAGTTNIGDLFLTFQDGLLVGVSGSTSGITPVYGSVGEVPFMNDGVFDYNERFTFNTLSSILQVGSVTDRGDIYIRNNGILRFYSGLTNHISLQAPSGFTGPNFTLQLPTGVGGNGQVLTSNGSGFMYWSEPGSSSTSININEIRCTIDNHPNIVSSGSAETFAEVSGYITTVSLIASTTGTIDLQISRTRGMSTDIMGSISLSTEKTKRIVNPTGWAYTDILEGDILDFNFGGSVSGITRCTATLRIEG